MGLVTKWFDDYQFTYSTARGNLCIFYEGVSAGGGAIDVDRAQGAFWILLAGVILGSSGVLLEHTMRLLRLGLKAMGIRSFSGSQNFNPPHATVTQSGSAVDTLPVPAAVQRYDRRGNPIGDVHQVYRTMSTSYEPAPPPESAKAYQPLSGGGNAYNSSLKYRRKFSDRRI